MVAYNHLVPLSGPWLAARFHYVLDPVGQEPFDSPTRRLGRNPLVRAGLHLNQLAVGLGLGLAVDRAPLVRPISLEHVRGTDPHSVLALVHRSLAVRPAGSR